MKSRIDSIVNVTVIGLALFSMFFGAGNLIFPPRLGTECGPGWITGFIFYFLIDIGLGVFAVFSMVQHDGDTDRILSPIGRLPAKALMILIILCIGPGIAIPRTAATTYEMGILPILGRDPDPVSLALFSLLFFGLVLLLSLRSGRVVDIIGKFMTPVLLLSLILMIVKGVAAPLGTPQSQLAESTVKEGVLNGYQTLDMLAGILFTMILISAVRDRGYRTTKEIKPVIIGASIIAGVLLFCVYGGLTYLGASSGSAWASGAHAGTISDATLLVNIAQGLLGRGGILLLAVVVTFACLTTAISLVSASADYFSKLLPGRISYEKLVVTVCVVSCLICNLGLTRIIGIAGPVLMLVYPVTLTLVLESFLFFVIRERLPYMLSAVVAFVLGALGTLAEIFPGSFLETLDAALPLSSMGFGWLVPAAAAFLIGLAVVRRRGPRA